VGQPDVGGGDRRKHRETDENQRACDGAGPEALDESSRVLIVRPPCAGNVLLRQIVMRYKIAEIGESGIELDHRLTGAWLAESCPELRGALGDEGLRLKGRLELLGEDYLMRGSLRGAIETECTRCLEPTKVPVDVDIAVQFVEQDPNLLDSDPEGGGDFVQFSDGIIDLTPEVREEIFLAVPMNPICDPPCKGICAHCGANLDKTTCDCESKQRMARSPFAALAKLS